MIFVCTVFENVYIVNPVHVPRSGLASRLGWVRGHDKNFREYAYVLIGSSPTSTLK